MVINTKNIINNVSEIFDKGCLIDIGSFIPSKNSDQQLFLKYIVGDDCYLLTKQDTWEIFRVDVASQSDKEFAQHLYYTSDKLENGISIVELPSPSKDIFVLVKSGSEQVYSLSAFSNFRDLLHGLLSERKLGPWKVVFSSENIAASLYSGCKWVSIRQLVNISYIEVDN